MYEARLFDQDGVLLDTERMAYEIWRDYLREHAGRELTLEDYAEVCGAPVDAFDRYIARLLPSDPDGLREHWAREVNRRVAERKIPPMPGFAALMAFLDGYPGKKAVVTSNNATWSQEYRQIFRYREHFDGIFHGGMVPQRKPEPDLYLLACRELGVTPGRCLAVEDSLSGILAAQRAGVPVLHMAGISAVPEDVERACVGRVRDLNETVAFLTAQESL